MEPAETTFSRLVEQRLKALDTNAFAFEKAHALPEDAVRSVLRGGKKTGTALNRAQELCAALGLEFYIGPQRPAQAPPPINDSDFARIPLVDAQLSAGAGAHNGDEDILDHLAFRNDWLKKLGLNPAHAVLARVSGDSMRPTLSPGDTILIDTSHQGRRIEVRSRPPRKGKAPIYAFRTGDDERVKRLIRPDQDTLVVLSDNPEWAPEVMTGAALKRAELGIIGKVVWWGHTCNDSV